jgi:hypothetical protein
MMARRLALFLTGTDPNACADFFKDGISEHRVFGNDMLVDEDGFIGGSLSSSYAPKEGAANYRPFIDALRRVFANYSVNGLLRVPNNTICYIGRV